MYWKDGLKILQAYYYIAKLNYVPVFLNTSKITKPEKVLNLGKNDWVYPIQC